MQSSVRISSASMTSSRAGEPAAYLVEYGALYQALEAAVRTEKSVEIFAPDTVVDYSTDDFSVVAKLGSGAEIKARLLVASDGKRSRLREAAGIKCVSWSYPQVGIVTTVAHTRPHHGRAVQHFLPAGPFAMLPLTGNRSSIVWTEEKERGAAIMALDAKDFTRELATRFGARLGEIKLAGPRQSFPLEFQIARSFIADRLALIGDAAHVVHPLAGQGLNIGMRDVAALAETIVEEARLGLDIGSGPGLERYQRWRRFDSAFSGAVMDGLNRLFSNDNAPLRVLRDLGLGLVDRVPAAEALPGARGRWRDRQRAAPLEGRAGVIMEPLSMTKNALPRDIAAAAADLLDQGATINRLSRPLTIAALIGLIVGLGVELGALLVAGLLLVTLAGLAETYLAIRTGFDAKLFRRLAEGNDRRGHSRQARCGADRAWCPD